MQVHGNLVVGFKCGQNSVRLKLIDVAYVPRLSYHLLLGHACVKQGHIYLGDHKRITANLSLASCGFFLWSELCTSRTVLDLILRQFELAPKSSVGFFPLHLPTIDVDINAYHRSTAHAHYCLFLRSAEQQSVNLRKGSKLLPCVGCSKTESISAPVSEVNEGRSDKKLRRVFVDPSGKKAVQSNGGN